MIKPPSPLVLILLAAAACERTPRTAASTQACAQEELPSRKARTPACAPQFQAMIDKAQAEAEPNAVNSWPPAAPARDSL